MTLNSKIAWRLLYVLLAKWLPSSCHSGFSKNMRSFFGGRALFSRGTEINIERGATFGNEVSLGSRSGIGINCELHGPITIGDDVMMAPDVVIYTKNHCTARCDLPMNRQGDTRADPVVIGNDVWLGRRCMIMPGVTIGEGSIVGAGAVVTKDIPPYSVAGGIPATVIKTRNG